MHKSSLDLNLGQHSNNNNYNININNNNNNNNNNRSLSISTSNSNDNECIFNCSNTKDLLISNNNNNTNNNNNNTKTGRQMMAAQETKTAEESLENVRSANITNVDEMDIGIERPLEREKTEQRGKLSQTVDGVRAKSGILVDESASYEIDEYGTVGTERMQLNPSGDDDDWDEEYDEDEDEDETDDEEMDSEDDEEAYGDKDTEEEESKVEVVAQERDVATAYETLPEAKGLVQSSLVVDENESVKNMPNVMKAKSITHTASASNADEEEDMGFDEDDERIAIIVERQRGGHTNDNDKGFMNEEGSGTEANRYKNNRFRLDYLDKYRKKQQKLHMENTNRGVTDAREGSGNFANDDDDDDDDDSDDDDDDDDDGNGDDVDAGAAADANDDADRQEGDGYFNSKHTKSSNRYFRKNTNDAIKIISTPLGKVGIVYQQTPNNDDGNSNNKKQDTHGDKKTSSFTDFDALSPDPESSHRLASSHPKITPVLTPDGKVALLYRGDSENSKYEPIRNLTHKFSNNKNDFTDNKATATSGTINKDTPDFQSNDGSEDESANESEDDDDYDLDNDNNNNNNERLQTNSRKNGGALPTDETQKAAIQNPATDADTPASGSGGSFIIRPTDSVLPIINRPLSEVLGIKKNQFKQFRIKDHPTTPPNAAAGAESAGDPRSLAGTSIDRAIDTTTLHFLTKVNLAEYPTSMKTRNFDFDFSRDNTMLDERTRFKEQQYHQQQQQQQGGSGNDNNNYPSGSEVGNSNNKLNTIANEEVLAKTEVVNLAIIPHFDDELERLQRLREHETRRHYRQRYRQRPSEEDLSGIHCIMQAMMGIAAISTVFGMLGTFFKQRILDQIRLMHW